MPKDHQPKAKGTWGGYRPGAGGRKLPEDQVRKLRNIRFSDLEWQKIRDMAQTMELPVSEFIRGKIFG